ncbi:NTP transferase domain-containing protein [Tropicimonas sp. IMCC34011]|uniref:nucleotidyltransferase family protein n=1 Tax=Tropicimonas sp. IMCC34011 TaxID=2248759 RepID=UPI000E26F2A8|nr:nucleotidyltransferase family protein [Tropicimonas sp. IMCC34011]
MSAGVPLLILAAGASRRMAGRDKLIEPVDGVPLLRRTASEALAASRATGSGPVTVLLPGLDHPRAEVLDRLDVARMEVPDHAEGMGATIRTGAAAFPDAPRLLILLGDMPEIGREDIASVLSAPGEAPDALVWRGSTEDGRQGHPILFDASLIPHLLRLSGDDGGRAAVTAAGERLHLVHLPGRRARRDLDTPEDWSAWRRETGR